MARVTVEPTAAREAEAGAEDEPAKWGLQAAPLWVRWASGIICLVGFAVAGYLTYAHYTTASVLACPETGIVNCALVTTSKYSHVGPIPVAVAGLAWFAVMVALCSPSAWRARSSWVPRLRMGGSIVGVLSILWLIYAELFELNAICLYCTAVHLLTFLLFVTLMIGWAASPPRVYEER